MYGGFVLGFLVPVFIDSVVVLLKIPGENNHLSDLKTHSHKLKSAIHRLDVLRFTQLKEVSDILVKIHSFKKVINLVTKPLLVTQKEIGDLTGVLNHGQQFSGMMETAPSSGTATAIASS